MDSCIEILSSFYSSYRRRVTHYVVVKRDLTAVEKDTQVKQMHEQLKKVVSSFFIRYL